jgi:hypothetical protein
MREFQFFESIIEKYIFYLQYERFRYNKVKRPFQMFLKNIAGKQEGRECRHTVISYYLLQFFQIINLSTVIIL